MISHFYQSLSRKCVKEVARDEGLSMENLLTKVRQEPSVNPTRMWNREVMDKHPIGVEVFSTFRSPVFVPWVRTEQVKKNSVETILLFHQVNFVLDLDGGPRDIYLSFSCLFQDN